MVTKSHYSVRNSALEKPRNWELSEQAISCTQEAGINKQILFSDIQKIRLFYHPNNRYRLNNYCCKITSKSRENFEINSCTYNGFADFIDQAETYTPFVKELVQKAKAANPECKLLTGHTPFTYYGNIFFVIVAVAFLFLLFSWVPAEYKNGFIIIKLIVIGYFGIYLAKSIKVNKPKQLDGTEIPGNVLPKLAKRETDNTSMSGKDDEHE